MKSSERTSFNDAPSLERESNRVLRWVKTAAGVLGMVAGFGLTGYAGLAAIEEIPHTSDSVDNLVVMTLGGSIACASTILLPNER